MFIQGNYKIRNNFNLSPEHTPTTTTIPCDHYFGGEGGIRTHGNFAATTVFETVLFNHSSTSPFLKNISWRAWEDSNLRPLAPQANALSI